MAAEQAVREQMNVVVVGHVDHGKSTLIGRLLADTGALPEGKLEQIQEFCRRNARPFEYAFLLDALKDEQAQGITIDSARCFFRSAQRDYIIIDAPGHVEFLKNMVSGAARAEAALLVIDAHEGIRENSRRHGTMLSMLGVRQVVVLVNKMDLVGYDLGVFGAIEREYTAFLGRVGLEPAGFVPICARDGVNISTRAPWYEGLTVLEQLDAFPKERGRAAQPFRLPVQDIYKFTAGGDERRIIAGTVETGTLALGDAVVAYPSGKRSVIRSIEAFNRPPQHQVAAGEATGFTLNEELYLRPGELLCRADDAPPAVSTRLRVNIFWMGKAPLRAGRPYKLKLAAARVAVQLAELRSVMDASDLSSSRGKTQVERHDVAECVLETAKPVAFDLASELPVTGRFVIVDNYEIAGGGIVLQALGDERRVLEAHVSQREAAWESGAVALHEREARQRHRAKLVVAIGPDEAALRELGCALERRLFDAGHAAYYLGLSNLERGIDAGVFDGFERRDERVRRLGELARILTASGQIVITVLPEADQADLETLRALNAPQQILTVQQSAARGDALGLATDLVLDPGTALPARVQSIWSLLEDRQVLPDFVI